MVVIAKQLVNLMSRNKEMPGRIVFVMYSTHRTHKAVVFSESYDSLLLS